MFILTKLDVVDNVRSALSVETGTDGAEASGTGAESPHKNVTFADAIDASVEAFELWLMLLSPALKEYSLAAIDFLDPIAQRVDETAQRSYNWVVEHPPAGTILLAAAGVALLIVVIIWMSRFPVFSRSIRKVQRYCRNISRRLTKFGTSLVSSVGAATIHVTYWAVAIYFILPPRPHENGALNTVTGKRVSFIFQTMTSFALPVVMSVLSIQTQRMQVLMCSYWVVFLSWTGLSRITVLTSLLASTLPTFVCPLLQVIGSQATCESPDETANAMAHMSAMLSWFFSLWLVLPVFSGAELLLTPMAEFFNRHIISIHGATSNASAGFSRALRTLDSVLLSFGFGDAYEYLRQGAGLIVAIFAGLLLSPDLGYWFLLCWHPTFITLEKVLPYARSRARTSELQTDWYGPLSMRLQTSLVLLVLDSMFRVANSFGILWIPLMSSLQCLAIGVVQFPIFDAAHNGYVRLLQTTLAVVHHLSGNSSMRQLPSAGAGVNAISSVGNENNAQRHVGDDNDASKSKDDGVEKPNRKDVNGAKLLKDNAESDSTQTKSAELTSQPSNAEDDEQDFASDEERSVADGAEDGAGSDAEVQADEERNVADVAEDNDESNPEAQTDE